MNEIIKLEQDEWALINGVLVKSVEFAPNSMININWSRDAAITLILNKYSRSYPDKIESDQYGDYYSGVIDCAYGSVEIDFIVIIKRSHMYIERVEVKL